VPGCCIAPTRRKGDLSTVQGASPRRESANHIVPSFLIIGSAHRRVISGRWNHCITGVVLRASCTGSRRASTGVRLRSHITSFPHTHPVPFTHPHLPEAIGLSHSAHKLSFWTLLLRPTAALYVLPHSALFGFISIDAALDWVTIGTLPVTQADSSNSSLICIAYTELLVLWPRTLAHQVSTSQSKTESWNIQSPLTAGLT
jgi:hypothetical protein